MTHYIYIIENIQKFYQIGIVENFNSLKNILNEENLIFYEICLNIQYYNEIINLFLNKYQILSSSHQIFNGNIYNMIDDIHKINKYILNVDVDINNSFHEYYGGKCNYFKVVEENNVFKIKCIEGEFELINTYYINHLIENNIIEINKIYDLNNISLLDNIINNVKILKIENFDIFLKYNNFNKQKLTIMNRLFLLFSNFVINENYPLQINIDNIWNNYEVKDYYSFDNKIIKLIKINNLLYELNCLKLMIPYIIKINSKTKEYIFVNLYYGNLGEDYEDYLNNLLNFNIRENLFIREDSPWSSETNMLKYINKYNEIIKIYDLQIKKDDTLLFL
jgi:hypothetical protein